MSLYVAKYPDDLSFLSAIVEQVKDGSTLRLRLLLPDDQHQFINIALAGVRAARASSKQGEASEPWGEEVGCELFVHVSILTSNSLGQILHRVPAATTIRPRTATFASYIDGDSLPIKRKRDCTSTGDYLHRQRSPSSRQCS